MTTLIEPLALTQIATTSPEIELLLCCARTNINPETSEAIKILLQKNIDWTFLFKIASQHRVLPLLCSSLKQSCPEAIPKEILTQLHHCLHNTTLSNILLTQELLRVLDLFETHNISTIPFKGPILAATAYGNLALRQFHDLDILVQKLDMLKAQELLLSQGYVMQRKALGEKHLNQANQNIYLQSQYRYDEWYWKTLDHKSLFGARVELHWATTPNHIIFPLHSEQLWQNLESVSILGMTFPSLSPEILLPILCTNYAKDHWTQLKMICDIARLIHAHQELDWQEVVNYANSLRRIRTLFVGLLLAQNLLGIQFPQEIQNQMQKDQIAKSLSKQVQQRLFQNHGCEPGILEKTFFNLQLRETLQDQFRYTRFSLTKVFEQLDLYMARFTQRTTKAANTQKAQ